MKIINPYVESIREEDPFIKIELAGRTCYKSEDKITDKSAVKFTRALMKSGHTAMVEHATFCFEVDTITYYDVVGMFTKAKYLNCTSTRLSNGKVRYLISGNLRAINEFGNCALLKALEAYDPNLVYVNYNHTLFESRVDIVDIDKYKDLTSEEKLNHRYHTYRFVTDRGVTHELVRHRPCSFAQESTRYCAYNKEQFGKELTFIRPAKWCEYTEAQKEIIENGFKLSEQFYMSLLESGMTAQCARALLPNGIKTEIVVTANEAEWEHFFNLRSRGTTGAPHPDMKLVADMALALYAEE